MDKLYKIGDVSKLCNVSVKALRYYEELNLIKPSNVDIYTGYRYYDEENVKKIKQILFLKDLNFSLQEIADFDYSSFHTKSLELQKQINDLKKKLEIISSLKVDKGEIKMKEFVNDERVIGKWKYETSALSKEHYLNGDCYEDDEVFIRELYFLPRGQGYWIFNSWSKGVIYHFRGLVYTYELLNDKLILNIKYNPNEIAICLIYNKVNNKEYKREEIGIRDNVDLPFVLDEEVLGKWQVHDFIRKEKLNEYIPPKESKKQYIVELNFKDDGSLEQIDELGNKQIRKWTKNHILIKLIGVQSDCHYEIKTINDDEYLYYEWKTGDYSFGGKVFNYYVFKKVK